MSLCGLSIPCSRSGMSIIALLTEELINYQYHERKRIAVTSAHSAVRKNLTECTQTKDRECTKMTGTDIMRIVPFAHSTRTARAHLE